MPVVPAANGYVLGIHKQSDESTVGTVADYTVPVFTAGGGVQVEHRRIEVTDAATIEGDTYKGPTSWAKTTTFPALGASLGRFLQAYWPTDTKTGAGPYVHTFSGMGGTQSWIAMYETFTAGTLTNTFAKGLASSIGFSATADGGPLMIQFGAVGQTPSITAYTVTTADTMTNGHFTLQAASASVTTDVDTANSAPGSQTESMKSITITSDRNATPQPVVDSVTVSNIAQGKVANSFQSEWLYTSWDAYHASYFGSVAGTAASATRVDGALLVTCKHTVQSGWGLTIYLPAVTFFVEPPAPDAGGGPLTLNVSGFIQKPSSGDHIQPVLTNAVSSAY